MEAVTPPWSEVGFNATDRQVHLGQSPRCVVELLTVNSNVVALAAMRVHEPLGLDEHPARATTRVVHAPFVGLDHLHEKLDYRARRVELTAASAFRRGEATKEVFIDATENVLFPVFRRAETDARYEVDKFPKAANIKAWPRI